MLRKTSQAVLLALASMIPDLAQAADTAATGADETSGEAAVRYEVRSPGVTLKLSAEGRIVGLSVGAKQLERSVVGQTLLDGCRPIGQGDGKRGHSAFLWWGIGSCV